MGNTLQGPFSQGQQLEPAQINAIDEGQAKAWVNDGTTTIVNGATIDGDGNNIDITDGEWNFDNTAGLNVVNWPGITGSNATVTNCLPPVGWQYDAAEWEGEVNGSFSDVVATSNTFEVYMKCLTTSADTLVAALAIPAGMTITSLTVMMRNPSSVALPAVMPKIWLFSGDPSTPGTLVTRGYVADTTALNATYTAWHAVTISGISFAPTQATVVYLMIRNSSGANSIAGLRVTRPRITGTIAQIRQV
jgi:hypothetical protein